ncbi:hypothetical protein Taro_025097 [Colocasia esculenta]|uniref:ACT domain-containing protein ACR n=1 Tax=Colocasia esculenta TaxID=4460 RepID=A0A843V2B0_COLES|nr:hypothetical protein [Colocasia esculenta]
MGADMEWPVCLDEYQKLVNRMNTPRVVLDNNVCDTATLIKVDSAWKDGVLLEAVQVLADLNLSVKKAYFSSDGSWFMDVFHVTDEQGRKLTDESIRSYIEQTLVAGTHAKADCCNGVVVLELAGDDRPGLLSEVLAVLEDQKCDVVEANMWTHNGRVASLIHVKDEGLPTSPMEDPWKLQSIEGRLRNVLAVDGTRVRCAARLAAGAASMAATHADRRLHQMFLADSDCERALSADIESPPPSVSVQRWVDRGYSAVSVQCRDRPKLLFDVVCTLTDMDYVVFHGTIDTDGDRAHQEFYIRHVDGSPIRSEAERQRVIRCLQAAVQRRTSEGVRLELSAADERGLLTGLTRSLRENGLSVARAKVSAKGGATHGVFYVTDASGHPADAGAVEAARQRVGPGSLSLAEPRRASAPAPRKATNWSGPWEDGGGVAGLSYLGSLVRRNLYNLGLIKSCS